MPNMPEVEFHQLIRRMAEVQYKYEARQRENFSSGER